MGQNELFEKLYGDHDPRPEEERVEEPPVIKSRSGRAFLESLKNGPKPTDLCTADPGSVPD